MASSFSDLVNNLSEKLQKIKYKLEHDDKKFETCKIKYKYCNGFLKYKNFKDNLIEYKCLFCNKYCRRKFEEGLKERFFYACKFSNHDSNKFISLLQKVV